MRRTATDARLSHSREVEHDIARVPILFVNAYMVGAPGSSSWVLVDAGLPFTAGKILDAAEERFGADVPPQAIILTHGHFDHVGALADLIDRWDAPVYAHTLELPYLTGGSPYPPADPTVGGGLMARMSIAYPRGPYDFGRRMHALPSSGRVPHMRGWRWIHTPGHTPGHVSLFREADRTLIVGDAIVTTRQESALAVMMQLPGVYGPPAYFTPDWDAAWASVHVLAGLEPELLITGHGPPLAGRRMRRKLRALARNFDRVAIPGDGRYVHEPATAGKHGLISVPPATSSAALGSLLTVAAAGAGAALLIGSIARRRA